MRYGELKRRGMRRVRELDEAVGIPRPFDLDVLLDRLERHRGRPIDLHETRLTAGGPCGLWIQERDRDVIAYAADTSELHQTHIILHEVGHMIAEHPGDCRLSLSAVQDLVPTVQPELVRHLFARSAYAAVEEQEAEMIAALITFAVVRAHPSPEGSDQHDIVTRVERAFGA